MKQGGGSEPNDYILFMHGGVGLVFSSSIRQAETE